MRINGGTLSLDGPTQGSNPIVLDPQGSITLEFDLVAPVDTGPAGNGCTLPAQATIRVSPSGIDLVESEDLSVELDGVTHTLQRNEQPPRYEPALRSVYIPYTVDAETFVPNGPASSLYTLDGEGEIEDGGWTIPVTHAGHFELADASGIGAAALAMTGGLTASWRGLAGGPIRLRRTARRSVARARHHRVAGRGNASAHGIDRAVGRDVHATPIVAERPISETIAARADAIDATMSTRSSRPPQ